MRRDRLTGGTGDVNPQTLILNVSQASNDTTASNVINVPFPRVPSNAVRQAVMEILKVEAMVYGVIFPNLDSFFQWQLRQGVSGVAYGQYEFVSPGLGVLDAMMTYSNTFIGRN